MIDTITKSKVLFYLQVLISYNGKRCFVSVYCKVGDPFQVLIQGVGAAESSDSILASYPDAPGLILGVPDVAEIYCQRSLEESGQKFENVE